MSNTSGTPDKIDQMFHGLMSSQQELISKMKSLIVAKTPIDPGAFLDEYDSESSSPLSFSLQIDRPVLVEYILYAYTPAAAGTLSIGKSSGKFRSIPIVSTSGNLPGFIHCAMIVNPGDVFVLTSPGATALFLEVMGKSLSGTDWSTI